MTYTELEAAVLARVPDTDMVSVSIETTRFVGHYRGLGVPPRLMREWTIYWAPSRDPANFYTGPTAEAAYVLFLAATCPQEIPIPDQAALVDVPQDTSNPVGIVA